MDLKDWEDRYYKTLKGEERKPILDERIAAEEPSEELELIRKLYDLRYKPENGEPEGIDHCIRGLLYYKMLKEQHTVFVRYPKKEMKDIYRDLGKELAESYGETGEKVWYREMKHLGKEYIQLCSDDDGYRSIIWGIGRIKDRQFISKVARDIYSMTDQVPEKYGIEEEFKVLSKALSDAFCETFPEDARMLDNLREEKK